MLISHTGLSLQESTCHARWPSRRWRWWRRSSYSTCTACARSRCLRGPRKYSSSTQRAFSACATARRRTSRAPPQQHVITSACARRPASTPKTYPVWSRKTSWLPTRTIRVVSLAPTTAWAYQTVANNIMIRTFQGESGRKWTTRRTGCVWPPCVTVSSSGCVSSSSSSQRLSFSTLSSRHATSKRRLRLCQKRSIAYSVWLDLVQSCVSARGRISAIPDSVHGCHNMPQVTVDGQWTKDHEDSSCHARTNTGYVVYNDLCFVWTVLWYPRTVQTICRRCVCSFLNIAQQHVAMEPRFIRACAYNISYHIMIF